MYITRKNEEKIKLLLNHFPAVALLGPRQVGKTTLVKRIKDQLPKQSIYLDLENPVDLGAFDHPIEFLNSLSEKTVIIDEVQRLPEIFPVLRSVIDENRDNARFILLGSASPQLLYLSNETLAGRIAHLELTPFEFQEIRGMTDFRTHWTSGGFPEPFGMTENFIRKEWMKSFISAYIERDLRLLGLNTSPLTLHRLLQMIASNHGSLLNASNLSKSIGVSSPTITNAISFFERSFIIRLLQPWYTNIGKRLVKSPKIYIRDSGIINYLLGLFTYEDIMRTPMLGNLWEGYVIENIINSLSGEYQYYFYRTADGTECDLLVCNASECIAAIDVKFAATPKSTKSMTITIQDLNPQKAYFVIPDCKIPYNISDKLRVATLPQLIEEIKLGKS